MTDIGAIKRLVFNQLVQTTIEEPRGRAKVMNKEGINFSKPPRLLRPCNNAAETREILPLKYILNKLFEDTCKKQK